MPDATAVTDRRGRACRTCGAQTPGRMRRPKRRPRAKSPSPPISRTSCARPLATQRALLELALAEPLGDHRRLAGDRSRSPRRLLQQERLLEACLTLARSRCGLTRQEPDRPGRDRARGASHATNRAGSRASWHSSRPTIRGDAGTPRAARREPRLERDPAQPRPAAGSSSRTHTHAEHAVLTVANSGRSHPGPRARAALPAVPATRHRPTNPQRHGIGLGLADRRGDRHAHNATLTAHAPAGGGLHIQISFPAR